MTAVASVAGKQWTKQPDLCTQSCGIDGESTGLLLTALPPSAIAVLLWCQLNSGSGFQTVPLADGNCVNRFIVR